MKVGEEGGEGEEGEEGEGGRGRRGVADGHILLSVPGLCDAPPLIPRTEWVRKGEGGEGGVGGDGGERRERVRGNEQEKQM
jgi:hypothetical protein